jgi:glycosyltransferase involved in cell wall biosynthesis
MPNRLKILFITSWYPTSTNPLEGVFIREHAKSIYQYDDVTIIHLAGVSHTGRLWMLCEETNPQLMEGIPTYHYSFRKIPLPGLSYLIFLWGIWRVFRKLIVEGFHPDIIHANIYLAGVPAVILGRLYHIPVVITEHSTAFPRRLLSRNQIWKARLAFHNADKVLVVSHSLQAAIENLGIHTKFQIISNAVDQNLFYPANPPHNIGEQKRLLFVNRITLLKALSILNIQRIDWHLDVIGDGPRKSECERLVAFLGLDKQITLFGYLPKQTISEIMRQSDLFILPSHVETFSVVCAEALSSGLPVLATQCGGPEEFILQDVGRLIPVGEPEILAKELDWMMNHLEEFSPIKISDYAKRLFSQEVIGLQYHSLYESVLKRS